ncbi:hypothetical protein [Flavobacterium sp. AG291]|uniref:hypothetical protein n=1 Tax=Flavobacterium sp. AG291 TaxID=2184000 RepID=UPI000E0C9D50|nr:hypothetical protein [Flavobacterium sp. AG291]RDI13178.1 hypothetical protein DEU42_10388 [Flavobacterium sp. AG291]
MYYAKQIDPLKTKELFYATQSKYYNWQYEHWNLPNDQWLFLEKNPYNEEDDTAHFDPHTLKNIMLFLENEVIPSLENEVRFSLEVENMDLIENYGGVLGFIKLFNTNPGYLEHIGIYENDIFEGSGPQMAFTLNRFKNFLEYCLSADQPYKVYIE